MGVESRSGEGSSLDQTAVVRLELNKIINELACQTILDIPCGDFNWMKFLKLEGIKYVGADIVPSLVSALNEKYSDGTKEFICLDIVANKLPRVDLIFCRDLFVHLSSKEIFSALRNIKSSQSTWLFTTNFTGSRRYVDTPYFSRGVPWRPINLSLEPFGFPPAEVTINEQCTEGGGKFSDKSLSLYRVKDLPDY
jgi:hypothetical protein